VHFSIVRQAPKCFYSEVSSLAVSCFSGKETIATDEARTWEAEGDTERKEDEREKPHLWGDGAHYKL